jgi:hypothetical protein
MRRRTAEWLLDVVKKLLLELFKGETRAIVIVAVVVPSFLLLLWVGSIVFRRISEKEMKAALLFDDWHPPSAEEVAQVINPMQARDVGSVPDHRTPENQ